MAVVGSTVEGIAIVVLARGSNGAVVANVGFAGNLTIPSKSSSRATAANAVVGRRRACWWSWWVSPLL